MESNHEDRQLWNDLTDGDEQALEQIFRKYYATLYNYGLKLTTNEQVKDGIQEIFAYLWQKRRSLSNANSIKAYLLVSLRRHLMGVISNEERQSNANKEYSREQNHDFFTAEDFLIFNELENSRKKELKTVLDKIPARMREALYLRLYNNLSYKEIAEIMAIKPQVARNYVSEAIERLRELFHQKSEKFYFFF